MSLKTTFILFFVALFYFINADPCVDIDHHNLKQGCHVDGLLTICYQVNSMEDIKNGVQTDELLITGCDIEDFDMKDFPVRLRKISVENGEVEKVAAACFSTLTNLEEVIVVDSPAKNVHFDVYEGISITLTRLLLNNCGLHELPPNGYVGFPNLEIMELYNNDITHVEEDSFTGLGNLKTLTIGDNHLSSLPPSTFQKLTSLEILDLENNDLGYFHNTSFNGLNALKELDLTSNKIVSLFPGIFNSDLAALEYLYLGGNDIQHISPTTFEQLVSLKVLVLDNNKLTQLEHEAFAGLVNIKTISLRNNGITTVDSRIFLDLPNLALLELDYTLKTIRNDLQAQNQSVAVVFLAPHQMKHC